MGNSQSFSETFTYHTAVEPTTPGYSATYRAVTHATELVDSFVDRKVTNAWELFDWTVKKFPHRRFIGRRFRDDDGRLGDFEWMTYSEAQQIALTFGSALIGDESLMPWIDYGPQKYKQASRLRVLGFFTVNCVEWFLAEQACNAYSITLCPLYDTLGDEALEYILRTTRMVTTLCAFENFETLLHAVEDPNKPGTIKADINLRNVILVNPGNPEDYKTVNIQFKSALQRGSQIGLNLLMWHQVVKRGSKQFLPLELAGYEDVNTLCYTSGTTGLPKGVILTHKLVCSVVIGAVRGPINPAGVFEVGAADCTLSYLPLAHVLERCVCQIVITKGACIGVYSGDMSMLMDDIKCFKPTVFVSVPRLYNRINDRVALTLQAKPTPTQILFNHGLNSKIQRRRTDSIATHKVWDTVVFSKIKAMMGGRLRGMISGGAPLDPAVTERMTAFFGAPLMQGYGLSETFGPCFLAHAEDNEVGHIGGLWPSVEFKLQSVPELNYLVTDPKPRGELLLRGPGIAPGYFLNDEDTEAVFDQEGWFHTGDIGEIANLKTISVAIIDRKKNIFKLAQGEYVAPEKIESVYLQCMTVGQIFVFGYSSRTFLVGLVHPDIDVAKQFAENNRLPSRKAELPELCNDPDFKQHILKEMEEMGKRLALKGFEKVRYIHLISEPFTVENDLLTPTTKLRRAQIKQAYQKELDDLYEEGELSSQAKPQGSPRTRG